MRRLLRAPLEFHPLWMNFVHLICKINRINEQLCFEIEIEAAGKDGGGGGG